MLLGSFNGSCTCIVSQIPNYTKMFWKCSVNYYLAQNIQHDQSDSRANYFYELITSKTYSVTIEVWFPSKFDSFEQVISEWNTWSATSAAQFSMNDSF